MHSFLRRLAIAGILSVLFSLAACGGPDSESTTPQPCVLDSGKLGTCTLG